MDFDISHLSPKARTRLGWYFRKSHLPKVFWWIPVVAIIIGIGLAFCVDQVSNHDTTALIVLGVTVFVFFCGYFAWILKKEPQVYKKFKDKFIDNKVFPKCFECNKANPGTLEKCGACGADLKIKLLDELTPNGILSFDNMLQEKPVQHSAGVYFYGGIAWYLFYVSLSFNFCLLAFHWVRFTKGDTESVEQRMISYLESKVDINNGMIRYLIPSPGGSSTDYSGRLLNRVPVYYNYYDRTDTGINFFGITMMEPAKTLAIDHAVTYNRYVSRTINYKDFIKQNKDSMVMLDGPSSSVQHKAKVLIFPNFYFDQKVIVKLSGNPDFQGTVCGIETDKTGKITYAVRIDPQTVSKDIPEDNITLIPDPPKTETPGVAAPKRKKVN